MTRRIIRGRSQTSRRRSLVAVMQCARAHLAGRESGASAPTGLCASLSRTDRAKPGEPAKVTRQHLVDEIRYWVDTAGLRGRGCRASVDVAGTPESPEVTAP